MSLTELTSRREVEILRHIEGIRALLAPRCTRCLHPISAPESLRLGMGRECRRQVAS